MAWEEKRSMGLIEDSSRTVRRADFYLHDNRNRA
jgi:hypothetical protein